VLQALAVATSAMTTHALKIRFFIMKTSFRSVTDQKARILPEAQQKKGPPERRAPFFNI